MRRINPIPEIAGPVHFIQKSVNNLVCWSTGAWLNVFVLQCYLRRKKGSAVMPDIWAN